MSSSHECKEVSRQIRNVNDEKWIEQAGDLCFPGIRAKFFQNPYCMDTLITRTSTKCITECTSDKLWGNGSPLHDPNCLDPSRPQGIMGQMLESIRSEILSTQVHPNHSQPRTFGPIYPEPPAQYSDSIDVPASTNGLIINRLQLIPTHNGITHHPDGSNPSSASTTPVSDTTATETDQSEVMAEDNTRQGSQPPNDEQAAK